MELNCLYDNEISPKELFNRMKTNIYNNFSSISFLSISKEYLSLRSDLFSLLKKISSRMGFKSQTYFLSVYYLDILFSQNKKIDCNHNTLGLACLLLSAKYCENDPEVPELKYFIKIYNKYVGSKNSISVSDLFYSEVIACKMLNHKLNYYTVYDFNSFFFMNNILKKEQLKDLNIDYDKDKQKEDIKYNKFSAKEKKIMEKIYKKSRHYLDSLIYTQICLKYNSLLLSIYTMKKSIEFILVNEQMYDRYEFSGGKERFLKKTNDYFNSILNDYYNFDYENMPEYQKLIEEYDFIKIFKTIKKEKNDLDYNYTKKTSEASTSFNKTPTKKRHKNSINFKSLNQRISEINHTSTKKNLSKLKSSNNLNSKIDSTNSLLNFSGKNMPRVSFHKNKDINFNNKVIKRNLGVDNCNENYKQEEDKEKMNSEKKEKNKDDNKIVYIFRLNSQNSFGNRIKFSDKKVITKVTSPFKFVNYRDVNNKNFKRENLFKKTKTEDLDKNIYSSTNENNKTINKDDKINNNNQNINNNKTINTSINKNRPYSKKVVQNCGNKLKNFNQISNKYNKNKLENNKNNNNKDLIKNVNEKNEEKKNNNIKKPIYNVVNRMPKFKIVNNINNDTKGKINMNKKYNATIRKDNNNNTDTDTDTKKEYRDYNYNNNKNKTKKISQILHINLNPKISNNNNNNNNTPIGSFLVNKKKDDFFSSTAYINRTNAKNKQYESKTISFAQSIDNKINNSIKSNNLNKKLDDIFSKKENDSNRYKNYEKRKYNYLSDSNDFQEKIFSNTLTTSFRGTRQTLFNLRKDKDKKREKEMDKSDIDNNKKILLTDYTQSGDENVNNMDVDLIDDVGNRKYINKTINNQATNKYKRIQVKKNKGEYDYYNTEKNQEKYKNYNKKDRNQDLALYNGYLNKKSDYRNFEESNDEDSNTISQRKYLLYSKKNRKIEDENSIVQQYKKNPSTIVINNNININFGNKTNVLKDKKKYKNFFKNSQIQINNNNGPNSISSLLHKIPLCYNNNHEANINVRKNNFINISNK